MTQAVLGRDPCRWSLVSSRLSETCRTGGLWVGCLRWQQAFALFDPVISQSGFLQRVCDDDDTIVR